VHSLIGPNGAGKSTLVNVIAGALTPDAGVMSLGGQRLTKLTPRRARRAGITRTFQRCRVFPDLTCEENIRVGAHATHSKGTDGRVEETIERLMTWTRLAGRRYELARNLALAEQRRLEIARAVASPASVLLLDEPTAGMGPNETAEVQHLVRETADKFGMAVVLVAHDMELVMTVSDYIVVLDFGAVIARGQPHEVRGNERVIEAYLGVGD
jgi:branched-chain amino acid transport system ATP-binding protein